MFYFWDQSQHGWLLHPHAMGFYPLLPNCLIPALTHSNVYGSFINFILVWKKIIVIKNWICYFQSARNVIIAPIAEEVVFRGCVCSLLVCGGYRNHFIILLFGIFIKYLISTFILNFKQMECLFCCLHCKVNVTSVDWNIQLFFFLVKYDNYFFCSFW